MLPSQQGYDRAITVFSPDGRLYQVEYAIETVHRGTVAVGIKSAAGVVIAVEERHRKLQIAEHAQKIFPVADHIGVAAAGYIPDARSLVDDARMYAQSNKLIYDESVGTETLSRHLADTCQSYTQYAGIRPVGVSLIIAGADADGSNQLYMTDPSGTYISYNAVAIGSKADDVTKFLEKNYEPELGIDDASVLAAAAIQMSTEKDGSGHIRMARIVSGAGAFESVPEADVAEFAKAAESRFAKE